VAAEELGVGLELGDADNWENKLGEVTGSSVEVEVVAEGV
jgi:hypothetical protein